jgi:hypothetical protein
VDRQPIDPWLAADGEGRPRDREPERRRLARLEVGEVVEEARVDDPVADVVGGVALDRCRELRGAGQGVR